MGLTYFKRFRMEIDLVDRESLRSSLPFNYRMVSWDPELLEAHAEAKFLSFRSEIDASVFPCLGEASGCLRLMNEISCKEGFLPDATWLVVYQGDTGDGSEFCGTVQGICATGGYGGIQNLGIVPQHRGLGLGTLLVDRSLKGFRRAGLRRAYLEVTAQNKCAIKLYERMGFSKARTLYKAVEVAVV